MDVAPWMDEMGLDHRVEWGIEQSVSRYRAPLYGANNKNILYKVIYNVCM